MPSIVPMRSLAIRGQILGLNVHNKLKYIKARYSQNIPTLMNKSPQYTQGGKTWIRLMDFFVKQ